MRRFPSRLIGVLLAALAAMPASAQIATEKLQESGRPLPQSLPVVTAQPVEGESFRYFSGERMTTNPPVAVDPGLTGLNPTLPAGVLTETMTAAPSVDLVPTIQCAHPDPIQSFLGYRYEVSSTDWMIGNGQQFGMFSLTWDHYQSPGVDHGLGAGVGIHFLSGPVTTDMPPRAYDFSLAYQHRDRLGAFGYDVAVSVMASSDFEGSAREGIRFPCHAVGFLSMSPTTDLVFGVDYLDRGDVKLLPVGGLIVVPHPDLRLEFVFPRPRAVFRLTGQNQLYVAGELGGNTWAIERTTLVDDLATYRDLRVCVGLQTVDADGDVTAIEVGYLFDRRLEYGTGDGDVSLNDTAMIRLVRTF